MAKLEGTVSTGDAATRSYAGVAKVLATGPITVQSETNSEGKFAFEEMPAVSYTVTASAPGLDAQQTITLQPNQILQISLQLKPTLRNQAAQTAMRAERDRGLAFTTISTSCPRATRKRISRSTEKPSSL